MKSLNISIGSIAIAMTLSLTVLASERDKKLPISVINAVIQSGIMSRDSGKSVTPDFLNDCVKERHDTYIEFRCDDLLWSYFLKIFKGKTASYIYFIEDGASVENRAFFRIQDDNPIAENDTIPTLITHKQVAKWLNKKFKTKKYSVELLQKIAHSHYRTRFSKDDGEMVTILSGEQSNQNHAYQPIGQVRWNGERFELK